MQDKMFVAINPLHFGRHISVNETLADMVEKVTSFDSTLHEVPKHCIFDEETLIGTLDQQLQEGAFKLVRNLMEGS